MTLGLLLIIVLGLTACNEATPESTPSSQPEIFSSPTAELAPPPTAIIAPTRPLDPTPVLDTRLPPEQWQEWPIIPSATERSIEIYNSGLAKGNNPQAFSKVGDCQNVKAAFMGYFDHPDRYNLGLDYQYLQETIDNFSGYFNTDGQAVKGGFNAATVLSPLWASPEVCLAGENPLECELRITKPSVVFISFEVWWEGRTEVEYEKYMRKIIETVIAHGAVPFLATKADNVEGDHGLNLTTARLAYEYNIPLWNFWLAVQPLPNHGLDPERNDGFHISTDGWNTRSFTGLQVLDSVWKGVRKNSHDQVDSIAPTTTPDVLTDLTKIKITNLPSEDPGDNLIVGLVAKEGIEYQPQGVYWYKNGSFDLQQLLGPGWNLQSTSPDGKHILVNYGPSLFITKDDSLRLLSDDFFYFGKTGAIFLPDGRIAYLEQTDGENAIKLIQVDGTELAEIKPENDTPIELNPSSTYGHLIWDEGSCTGLGYCDYAGSWITDLLSFDSRYLEKIVNPIASPDGSTLAYEYYPTESTSNLAFASMDGSTSRPFPLSGDNLAAFAWDPQGDWLAVSMAVRSEYSGRVTNGINYLVDPKNFITRQLSPILLINPYLAWSPGGEKLAMLGTDFVTDRYAIRLYQVDVQTGQVENLDGEPTNLSEDYIFVTNASWVKQP